MKRRRDLGVDLTPDKRAKNMQGPTDRPPWYGSTKGSDDVVRGAIERRYVKAKRTQPVDKKTQYKCCYCGNFYDARDLEIEHVNPFSEIGKQTLNMSELQMVANDDANLAYACGKKGKGCNQSKSDKPLFQYLASDSTKYKTFFGDYPEFEWMDGTASGSMSYTAPWKARALTGDQANPHPAYTAKVVEMKTQQKTDYRPRPPIGWEKCYFNLNNMCIGPVDSVEDCCKRAGVELKDVLDTTSDEISKDWGAKGIKFKSKVIQQICWQTMK
ncbi:MAG: hypothetical protein WA324_01640 [Bryobacteraceae bacterium]